MFVITLIIDDTQSVAMSPSDENFISYIDERGQSRKYDLNHNTVRLLSRTFNALYCVHSTPTWFARTQARIASQRIKGSQWSSTVERDADALPAISCPRSYAELISGFLLI